MGGRYTKFPTEKSNIRGTIYPKYLYQIGTRKLKVALIGSGRVSWDHLDVLNHFSNVDLVSIANRGKSDLKLIKETYGISKSFNDWEKMLAEVRPDLVFNLAGHYAIHPISSYLLKNKIPCFIEKPPGMNLKETTDLLNLAKESNCMHKIGFNRRCYSTLQKGISLIEEMGKLRAIHVDIPENLEKQIEKNRFSQEVLDSWVIANSSHYLDLLIHLGGIISTNHTFFGDSNKNTQKSYMGVVRFKNGCIGNYSGVWDTNEELKFKLYGEKVVIEFFDLLSHAVAKYQDGTVREITFDEVDLLFKPGFYMQSKALIDEILKDDQESKKEIDLESAVRTMAFMEKINQGLNQN